MSWVQKIKKAVHFLLAVFAYWYYGRPARKLIVVGVTGTKGKSTTCRFIASVLEAGGYKVGLLSTVEFQIGEKHWMNDKKMTMLGRGQIQSMLKQMVVAGCQYVVVETSSEGILQYRHYGLDYDIAVFTNLGTEHFERHGSVENLKRDKGKMFEEVRHRPRKMLNGKSVPKIIIANADSLHADYYLSFDADRKYGFAIDTSTKLLVKHVFQAKVLSTTVNSTDFIMEDTSYHLNLSGKFNVYNALAAIAVGETQSIVREKIKEGLEAVKELPGRMEFVEANQDFKVVVDYAHEALSYNALFKTLRDMLLPNNRLIVIIGSDGGGRDVSKRGPMGEIAGTLADMVIVSDVNCFDDDPREIAEMLAAGARKSGKKDGENLFVIVDRRMAIRKAFSLAQAGDIVALTAKGSEPCIVVSGGKKIPWDDRQVARELLGELKSNS